jgi:hypothetical protein
MLGRFWPFHVATTVIVLNLKVNNTISLVHVFYFSLKPKNFTNVFEVGISLRVEQLVIAWRSAHVGFFFLDYALMKPIEHFLSDVVGVGFEFFCQKIQAQTPAGPLVINRLIKVGN